MNGGNRRKGVGKKGTKRLIQDPDQTTLVNAVNQNTADEENNPDNCMDNFHAVLPSLESVDANAWNAEKEKKICR